MTQLRTLYLLFRLSRWRPPAGLVFELSCLPATAELFVAISRPGRYAALRINTALSVRRTLEALDVAARAVLEGSAEPNPQLRQAGQAFEEALKRWEA